MTSIKKERPTYLSRYVPRYVKVELICSLPPHLHLTLSPLFHTHHFFLWFLDCSFILIMENPWTLLSRSLPTLTQVRGTTEPLVSNARLYAMESSGVRYIAKCWSNSRHERYLLSMMRNFQTDNVFKNTVPLMISRCMNDCTNFGQVASSPLAALCSPVISFVQQSSPRVGPSSREGTRRTAIWYLEYTAVCWEGPRIQWVQ